MRPPQAPTSVSELLNGLRATRLLPAALLRELEGRWREGDARPHAQALVNAGHLTAFQAEEVLAGRARRLRLGPYLLLERLGAGGAGRVYKARHRLMGHLVALKVVGRAGRRGRLACLRREARALSGLSHPNVVAAHDATTAGGRLVLVLEHVEGADLRRVLADEGPLPVPLACEVVRQVAAALAHLHEQGLLHRDVKPANVLLDRSGPGPRVKLLDLGLARPIDRASGKSLWGTFDYMAPERGMGEPIDARSDLYSLGCTFYHLLTGQAPFPDGAWSAKLLRHRLDTPVPVRQLRPDVPLTVAAVVAKLLARDPADRYATAAEALASLEVLSAPVAAPPARPRRRRFPSALALLGAVVLGSALAGAARLAPRQPVGRISNSSSLGGGRLEKSSHPSLATALASAADGATVTVRGPGPYRLAPENLAGRSLTLRAAPGPRPVIWWAPAAESWDALLATNRDLTLEGLDLRAEEAWPLIQVDCASLRLRDCRLSGKGDGPLVCLRGGAALTMAGCRLESAGQAVAVELSERPCAVRLTGCSVAVRSPGAAGLSIWSAPAAAPGEVEVLLERCRISAGRALAIRAAGAGLARATGCEFHCREGLLSLTACRALRLEGGGNKLSGPGKGAWADGRPLALPAGFGR
jgi:serine/threonine protein kinase